MTKATYELPPRPTRALRNALFGVVTPSNPPPLLPFSVRDILGGSTTPDLMVHEKAHDPMFELFCEWERAGLLEHVLTIDRAHDPRFDVHNRPLSHAHGNAFDINTTWNPLRKPAAPHGQEGHLPEALYDIARQHGFWCGHDGHQNAHKHLELTRLA